MLVKYNEKTDEITMPRKELEKHERNLMLEGGCCAIIGILAGKGLAYILEHKDDIKF